MFLSGIEPHTDASVLRDVRARVERAAEIAAGAIDVSCDNGVVTLRGVVSSEDERDEAERIAFDVRGVFDVLNRLRVDPSRRQPSSDANAVAETTEASRDGAERERESLPVGAFDAPGRERTSEADARATEPSTNGEPPDVLVPDPPPSIH